MHLIASVALGLGLYNAVSHILPIYYSNGTAGLVPALLSAFSDLDRSRDLFQSVKEPRPSNEYDFIVVGAGTAGSVVANRLSEDYSVLLLERGGEPNPLLSVPELRSALLGYPETDYAYRTIPQKRACLSLNNQESLWNRGAGLGGTSNINGMLHLRGHPKDYDNWAQITGDERWGYENLIPFFKKSEDYCFGCNEGSAANFVQRKDHGVGGLLPITKPSYKPLANEFLAAMEWAGIPRVDLNAPYKEGSAEVTLNTKDGRRWTAYEGFIQPARIRSNLNIHKYARAYKVLFMENTTTAYGIEYEWHGVQTKAYATKEVILSAGTIDTPKILMLSGIGPLKHLQSLGIKCLIEAPVGQNLQDHAMVFPGPFTIEQPLSFMADRDLTQTSIDEYFLNGAGVLSTPQIRAVATFTSSRAVGSGQPLWPDTQWILFGAGLSSDFHEGLARNTNGNASLLKEYYEGSMDKDGFQVMVILSRPQGTGELLLKSADYRDDPLINPKYFEDMNDTRGVSSLNFRGGSNFLSMT